MWRSYRYLIGISIVIIVLLVLIIVLLVKNSAVITSNHSYVKPLASYATDPNASVSLLIDGPETGPSSHNQALIKVDNSKISLVIYQGYNNQVVKQESFANTSASFHVFLRSLEFADYTKFTNNPSLSQASGVCPTGDRYIFETIINNQTTERAWTTNCSGLPATFLGNFSLAFQQFTSQVPNYNSYTANYNF